MVLSSHVSSTSSRQPSVFTTRREAEEREAKPKDKETQTPDRTPRSGLNNQATTPYSIAYRYLLLQRCTVSVLSADWYIFLFSWSWCGGGVVACRCVVRARAV